MPELDFRGKESVRNHHLIRADAGIHITGPDLRRGGWQGRVNYELKDPRIKGGGPHMALTGSPEPSSLDGTNS
jgi:hypothetical protein